jgi:hypothetical protein
MKNEKGIQMDRYRAWFVGWFDSCTSGGVLLYRQRPSQQSV